MTKFDDAGFVPPKLELWPLEIPKLETPRHPLLVAMEYLRKRTRESIVERNQAAREFVLLWEYLRDTIGAAAALRDPRLKVARNLYRLSCHESTI